jgi:hypothetical protein
VNNGRAEEEEEKENEREKRWKKSHKSAEIRAYLCFTKELVK